MKHIVPGAVILAAAALTGCSGKKAGSDVTLVYWSMWNEAEAFTTDTGIKADINFNGRDIRKPLLDLARQLGGGSIKNIPYQPSTFCDYVQQRSVPPGGRYRRPQDLERDAGRLRET
jgi:hypothetical protein